MPWVDPSHRAVEATDADQVSRPKLSVLRVDNGDGTFSYYQQVHLTAGSVVTGSVDITIDGEVPDADTLPDGTPVPITKIRLGDTGRNDGLASREHPMPTRDGDTHDLLLVLLERIDFLIQVLWQSTPTTAAATTAAAATMTLALPTDIKMRLEDDGLVSRARPMPTRDATAHDLLFKMTGLLEELAHKG